MRKLIVLLMIFPVLLFSEEGLQAFDVKTFKVGKGLGEMYWDEGFFSIAGVATAAIGCDEDTIYIGDSYNNRGIVLDYNYNIKKYLNGPEDNAIWNSFRLTVFDEKYLLMDGGGTLIYDLETNRPLGNNNIAFFFEKAIGLDVPSGFIDQTNRAGIFSYLNVKPVGEYAKGQRVFNSSDHFIGFEKEVQGLLEKHKLIIYNDRLLTDEIGPLREFYQINNRHNKSVKDHVLFNYGNLRFLGYDKNNRSYWVTRNMDPKKQVLLVCSNYGELLFARQNLTEKNLQGSVAVLPDGSLLRLNNMPENDQFVLSKFPNTWDIPSAKDSEKHSVVITSSSFVDYKSMYTASRAFDGQSSTAWLEGHAGAGVGEFIKVSLAEPVMIDKIEIMPGYFDPQWFKANNRVKRLKLVLNGEALHVDFTDMMKPQEIKLDKEVSLKEALFIIEEVYLGKDSDTAISEIAFYLNGEKVELME